MNSVKTHAVSLVFTFEMPVGVLLGDVPFLLSRWMSLRP